MISTIVTWLTLIIEKIGYLGVMLSMFIESFFVPIPSELIMPFAGFLAGQGKMNLILLIILGGVSSYLGTLIFYFLGYLGNRESVENFFDKYGKYLFVSKSDIKKAFDIFENKGVIFIFFGRLIPIVRSLISIPAGISKINFFKFSIYTLLGSIIWSGVLAYLGYIFGNNWEIVQEYISKYEKLVIIAVVIFGLGFILSKLFNNYRRTRLMR